MLVRELTDVPDWKQLGLQLSLTPATLREIELYNRDVANMKSSMLDRWLRATPEAAWEDVVSALRMMGEERVAKSIEDNYCKDHRIASGA